MERIQKALDKAKIRREATHVSEVKPIIASREATAGHMMLSRETLAENWLNVPEITLDTKRLARNRVIANSEGPEAIYYDQLRTRLFQRMNTEGWQRIGITSPSSACGKTTLSVNLSMTAARNSEKRIFAFDFDLRRPSIRNVLGLEGEFQFARALDGRANYKDHIVRVGENLIFAPTTNSARNPAERLQSSHLTHILDEIKEQFNPDLMLFDLPPLFAADDVSAFADKLDAIIIVAAAEQTTVDEIDRAERELADITNIAGVVVNKCRYMGKEYGYAYYNSAD